MVESHDTIRRGVFCRVEFRRGVLYRRLVNKSVVEADYDVLERPMALPSGNTLNVIVEPLTRFVSEIYSGEANTPLIEFLPAEIR